MNIKMNTSTNADMNMKLSVNIKMNMRMSMSMSMKMVMDMVWTCTVHGLTMSTNTEMQMGLSDSRIWDQMVRATRLSEYRLSYQ
jgi:hypothetical protein